MPVVVVEGITCVGKTRTVRAIVRDSWFSDHATHLLVGEQITTVPIGAIENDGSINQPARRGHHSELMNIVDGLHRIANTSKAEGYNLPCIVLERFYLSLAVKSGAAQSIPPDLAEVDDWLCSMDALLVLLVIDPELIPSRLADAKLRRQGVERDAMERCFSSPGTACRLALKQANYQYLISKMRVRSLVVNTRDCAWEKYARLIVAQFDR